MLPHLLNQIPHDQEIGGVTADGAYDTCRCHNSIADRGAAAVIPPRRNAQPWKPTTAGAIARNDALRASRYLGRALWRNWSGYHRRNRVETKIHCMKLLGQRLMARDFDRQVAGVQMRVAILNGYTAIGIPVKSRGIDPSGERRDPFVRELRNSILQSHRVAKCRACLMLVMMFWFSRSASRARPERPARSASTFCVA